MAQQQKYPADAVHKMVEAGVRLIPWKDLKIKTTVGTGSYGEVFLGTKFLCNIGGAIAKSFCFG